MPIQTQQLLSHLNPLSAIDVSGFNLEGKRQQLSLLRQQFEETKRRNLVDEELRRASEAGQMRRAELQLQEEQARQQAVAEAKLREQQEAAYADFYKRVDARDFSGMQMAAQRLQEHGGLAESMGTDEQGRPMYRVGVNAADDARQQAALDQQAAPVQGDESSLQSLNRLNALGYDQANRGLVDVGALMDQSREQTQPVLDAQMAAYPEARQGSVASSNQAASLLGLDPLATLKAQGDLRSQVDPVITQEQNLEADREKAAKAAAPKPLTRMDIEQLAKGGASRAKEMYDNRGIEDTFTRSAAASAMIGLLTDDDPTNDQAIAFELPNMLGSKGAQSNKDLAVALGLDAMALTDQIKERIVGIIKGGYSEMRKDTLVGIIRNKMQEDDDLVYEYLDALHEAAGLAQDPEVRRGIEEYAVGNVPKVYRDAWEEDRTTFGPPEKATADGERQPVAGKDSALSEDFLEEFEAQAAEAGLDAQDILPLIHAESGGDPSIQNREGSSARGLIQFLDSTAQGYGFKDSKEFAQLSAVEQIPYILKYLKDRGVTSEHTQGDIYVAIAAPAALNEGDDFVAYRKDAETELGRDQYAKNTTWDLDNDGVITRDEIYRWGMGERKEGGGSAAPRGREEEPAPAGPDPTSDEPDALTSEHAPKAPAPSAPPAPATGMRHPGDLALLPFDTKPSAPAAPKKKGANDDELMEGL